MAEFLRDILIAGIVGLGAIGAMVGFLAVLMGLIWYLRLWS